MQWHDAVIMIGGHHHHRRVLHIRVRRWPDVVNWRDFVQILKLFLAVRRAVFIRQEVAHSKFVKAQQIYESIKSIQFFCLTKNLTAEFNADVTPRQESPPETDPAFG